MIRYSSQRGVSSRPGNVVVWVVVSLGVLLGIVALNLDGGRMMEQRRHAQNAADAACLAAAGKLYAGHNDNQGTDPDGAAKNAALAAATSNGFTAGSGTTVTVNIPPQSGAFTGAAGYVEVIITAPVSASFSRALTSGPLQVKARSVARGRPKNLGVLLLGDSGTAIQASGNGSLNVVGGPLMINSTDSAALALSGNAGISADYNDIAGGYTDSSNGHIVGTITTHVPPQADPLATLAAPNPGDYPVRSPGAGNISGNQSVTLDPGVYRDGISISGNGNVVMRPGVYILQGGGLSLSGNANLSGTGVFIYNTGSDCDCGQIQLSGNGTLNLTPATDGPYAGISIFQDRSATETVTLSGNGSLQVSGLIYAPKAEVRLTGNGSSDNTMGGGIVAASLRVSGNGNVRVKMGSSSPKVPEISLVE